MLATVWRLATLAPQKEAELMNAANSSARRGIHYLYDGPVAEGCLPAYNALNVFAVPQDHMVEFVSPFPGAHRLSITGWFRSR